jgi:hypothetical protein
VDWWATAPRDPLGRRRRVDTPCLMAIVVSLPRDLSDGWRDYRDAVIAYFESIHLGCLVAAVEHLDEAHPHVHLYVVPKPTDDFGSVHPGFRARREAKQNGDKRTRKAFIDAMRAWQDALYDALRSIAELLRLGPMLKRLTRAGLLAKRRMEAAGFAREPVADPSGGGVGSPIFPLAGEDHPVTRQEAIRERTAVLYGHAQPSPDRYMRTQKKPTPASPVASLDGSPPADSVVALEPGFDLVDSAQPTTSREPKATDPAATELRPAGDAKQFATRPANQPTPQTIPYPAPRPSNEPSATRPEQPDSPASPPRRRRAP